MAEEIKNTGIPENFRRLMEPPGGPSFDDVRVHYNSSKPAQLAALAYAQGSSVHIEAGQERHLPHDPGYVVQQKKGNVHPAIPRNKSSE